MAGPVCYRVKAPRMSEMTAWVQFNGLSPSDVPYPSQMVIWSDDGEQWWIEYTAYKRAASGVLLYDPATDGFRYEMRTVPLLYDPPMWWLEETAPMGTGAAPLQTSDALDVGETVADGVCNWD